MPHLQKGVKQLLKEKLQQQKEKHLADQEQ